MKTVNHGLWAFKIWIFLQTNHHNDQERDTTMIQGQCGSVETPHKFQNDAWLSISCNHRPHGMICASSYSSCKQPRMAHYHDGCFQEVRFEYCSRIVSFSSFFFGTANRLAQDRTVTPTNYSLDRWIDHYHDDRAKYDIMSRKGSNVDKTYLQLWMVVGMESSIDRMVSNMVLQRYSTKQLWRQHQHHSTTNFVSPNEDLYLRTPSERIMCYEKNFNCYSYCLRARDW